MMLAVAEERRMPLPFLTRSRLNAWFLTNRSVIVSCSRYCGIGEDCTSPTHHPLHTRGLMAIISNSNTPLSVVLVQQTYIATNCRCNPQIYSFQLLQWLQWVPCYHNNCERSASSNRD